MSIANRLISGSIASWMQIGVTVLAQVLLVPVYLSNWNVRTYGVWITIQAISTIMTSLDVGHHTYLSFEFMRLGKTQLRLTRFYLWSGVWVGIIIGCIPILITAIIILTGHLRVLFDNNLPQHGLLLRQAGIVLLLQTATWFLCSSVGGIFLRALSVFDYYARSAWWNAAASAITSFVPAMAVLCGANLLTTGLVQLAAAIGIYTFFYIDAYRKLREHHITYIKGSLRFGYGNFSRSVVLSVKNLLENFRNVGFRAILAPLIATGSLVAFSTIRTGANFAIQGLHSVTYPLMPDLMRFLHNREQERSETAFGTVWIIVVAIMSPALLTLQLFIAPLFTVWTSGKISFDPALFAILSVSVLVYAISQPAIAIVSGNNLLRTQFALSILGAVVVIGGVFIMVPGLGILGGGIVLLVAELVSAVGYNRSATRWLAAHDLIWPKRTWNGALISVIIAGIGMAAMIYLAHLKYLIFVVSLLAMAVNAYNYWQLLPVFARDRISQMLNNMVHNKNSSA